MSNEDPEYEERLRRRLEILRKEFEDGTISIPDDEELTKSLLAMRVDRSGKVDLSTVDGLVRSLALATEGMRWRENVKAGNSLRDINEEYFRFINIQFGEMYRGALERGLTINQAARVLASSEEHRKEVNESLPELLEQMTEFWSTVDDATIFHLQDYRGLKAVFGGDLFPASDGASIRTSAVYADTAIVPDPFLQSDHIFGRAEEHIKAFYFFKAALNLCSVARLALADVDPPIICVLPHPSDLSDGRREFVRFEMERLGLVHAGRIFGREFESSEQLFDFGKTLTTPEELQRALADPKRLLFDTDFDGPLEEQLKRYVEGVRVRVPTMTPGELVAFHCNGRMGQASDLLLKSRELHGVPMMDAPTSWVHLRWCLEYLADKDVAGERLVDQHILHALDDDRRGPLAWLGNIPEDALIEMRTTGGLHEVREKLGAGLNGIVGRDPADFSASSARVYANLDEWMSEHQKALEELRKAKLKFAGVDVASCIVYGAVEVAAAIGIPGVSLVNTFFEQTSGTPKLRELPAKYAQLRDQAHALSSSTAGIFFGARQGS